MDPKGEELAAVLAEIRQRVRARNPNGSVSGGIALPDLTPLLHARDAAEAKVASIGTVNPRPPGLLNSITQKMKRLVARALDWHVREQVEFNRAVMACVQSTLEVLGESNRVMAALSARLDSEVQVLHDETQQLKDIRTHWTAWRGDWENKLTSNEIHFLRSVADLQASFQHRVTLMDANYREQMKSQHADFETALDRTAENLQKRLWADMQEIQKQLGADLNRMRAEYESIIHLEIRLLRQKASFTKTVEQVVESAPADFSKINWLKFAERFRGSETSVKERQQMYAQRFRGAANILDIGCGRGEMLEVFREADIPAHGIDLNDDSIAICLNKGLAAERADLFAYFASLQDSTLGGVVCCQVAEHLPADRLPELIRLAHSKLRVGSILAIETPNPQCLAIFATHFYLDPTHRHPIPSALLSFYLEEAGFGRIEVERLYPAVDSMPSLSELPETFRKEFFGSLDYAIFATKLG
jgi:2-polyprenyl-3-methyl-5-hydroxy-6-metoxy-1,4-benzoquinol methylase